MPVSYKLKSSCQNLGIAASCTEARSELHFPGAGIPLLHKKAASPSPSDSSLLGATRRITRALPACFLFKISLILSRRPVFPSSRSSEPAATKQSVDPACTAARGWDANHRTFTSHKETQNSCRRTPSLDEARESKNHVEKNTVT